MSTLLDRPMVTHDAATGMADNLVKLYCVSMLEWMREQGYSFWKKPGDVIVWISPFDHSNHLTDEELYNKFIESCEQKKNA